MTSRRIEIIVILFHLDSFPIFSFSPVLFFSFSRFPIRSRRPLLCQRGQVRRWHCGGATYSWQPARAFKVALVVPLIKSLPLILILRLFSSHLVYLFVHLHAIISLLCWLYCNLLRRQYRRHRVLELARRYRGNWSSARPLYSRLVRLMFTRGYTRLWDLNLRFSSEYSRSSVEFRPQIYLIAVDIYLVNIYLVNIYLVNIYLVNIYMVNMHLVNMHDKSVWEVDANLPISSQHKMNYLLNEWSAIFGIHLTRGSVLPVAQ